MRTIQKNRERIRASYREYTEAQRERLRNNARRYSKTLKGRQTRAAWKKSHPGAMNAYNKKYYESHKKRVSAYRRKWYAQGFSQLTYLRRLEAIAGRPKPSACEICHKKAKKICFEHCHKTGKFRGWICSRCNFILGIIESPSYLKPFVKYLKRANA
jgi:hypothetical protein